MNTYKCKTFSYEDAKLLTGVFDTLTEEQLTALQHLELDQQRAGYYFAVKDVLKGIGYGVILCAGGYCLVDGIKGVKKILADRKTKKRINKNLDVLIKTTAEDFMEA